MSSSSTNTSATTSSFGLLKRAHAGRVGEKNAFGETYNERGRPGFEPATPGSTVQWAHFMSRPANGT